MTARRVHIVWAGLNKRLQKKLKLGGVFDPPLGSALLSKRASSNANLGGAVRTSSSCSSGSLSHHRAADGGGSGTAAGVAAGTSRFHHFAKDVNKGAYRAMGRQLM